MVNMICASCAETVAETERCPQCGDATALQQRYRLQAVVGHGAVGTTYRAERITDGLVVAIKELLVRRVVSAKAIELFEREGQVLAQLDHPGIPALHETLISESGRSVSLYLVQDFIAGQTLAAELEQRRFSVDEVLQALAELCETLAYLASLSPPVVHRDLKPANIMRRDSDRSLVLIDFGSVRAVADNPEGGSTVTGTFGYMAPEQFMGRAVPATDLYGLGATALALLTREDPASFEGANRQLVIPDEAVGDAELRGLLEWLLAAQPERRPGDPAALAVQLRARCGGASRALQLPGRDLPVQLVAAPRNLPARFAVTQAAQSQFQRSFGALFGGIGGGLGLVATVAGLLVGMLPVSLVGLGLLGLFGGVGATMFSRGTASLQRARAIYRNGQAVGGELNDVRQSSYRLNGRYAWIYDYRFSVGGRPYRGRSHRWDLQPRQKGDAVTVVYLPDRPEQNLLIFDDSDATQA